MRPIRGGTAPANTSSRDAAAAGRAGRALDGEPARWSRPRTPRGPPSSAAGTPRRPTPRSGGSPRSGRRRAPGCGPTATSANGESWWLLPMIIEYFRWSPSRSCTAASDAPVAGDVHRHGIDLGQRTDLVVGEHVGVPAERAHELDVAGRRQPDHPAEPALGLRAARSRPRSWPTPTARPRRRRRSSRRRRRRCRRGSWSGTGRAAARGDPRRLPGRPRRRRRARVHRVVGGLDVAPVDGSVRLAVIAVVAESVVGRADGEVDEAGHREPAVVADRRWRRSGWVDSTTSAQPMAGTRPHAGSPVGKKSQYPSMSPSTA